MKFAHFSDVHLGSWNNHPDMKDLPTEAFEKTIDECIKENVDFILIAGDLFDTSIPPIDIIKSTVKKLKQCVDLGIRIYIVPGSHDYSPTGKTMLGVLEKAGIVKDVFKYDEVDGKMRLLFTQDPTGAKITGVLGKMGALEKSFYSILDKSIEDEKGFKIFMLHSAIADYLPPHMRSGAINLDSLPKNFNYYANGHVHLKTISDYSTGKVAFPGPLFPTSFDELENYDSGFYIVEVNGETNVKRKEMKICSVASLHFDANNKSSQKVEEEIIEKLRDSDINGKIVLLKIKGTLESGRPTEIDFKKIFSLALDKGARTIKKSTSQLSAKEFQEVEIKTNMVVEDIEKDIIKESVSNQKINGFGAEEIAKSLMDVLSDEKIEGETNSTFEERIRSNSRKVLNL